MNAHHDTHSPVNVSSIFQSPIQSSKHFSYKVRNTPQTSWILVGRPWRSEPTFIYFYRGAGFHPSGHPNSTCTGSKSGVNGASGEDFGPVQRCQDFFGETQSLGILVIKSELHIDYNGLKQFKAHIVAYFFLHEDEKRLEVSLFLCFSIW